MDDKDQEDLEGKKQSKQAEIGVFASLGVSGLTMAAGSAAGAWGAIIALVFAGPAAEYEEGGGDYGMSLAISFASAAFSIVGLIHHQFMQSDEMQLLKEQLNQGVAISEEKVEKGISILKSDGCQFVNVTKKDDHYVLQCTL